MKFLPYVQESIAALGYIKPEFDTALAIMLEANEGQHPKEIARQYRKNGEQLTNGEKRSLGIRASAFYSREALQSLTDKGKSNLLEAHTVTLLRAMFSFFTNRMVEDARKANIHRFQVSGAFADCPGCKAMDGQIISSNYAAFLRPNSCAREACALTILPYKDYLEGIK